MNPKLKSGIKLVATAIVAIIIAVVITVYVVRDNQLIQCEANGSFKNTEAIAWASQAEADRKISNDPFQSKITREARRQAASEHKNTERDIRKTIPAPSNKSKGDIRGMNSIDRKNGCKEVYPAPIPFIE